jgi:O-antigen ligase
MSPSSLSRLDPNRLPFYFAFGAAAAGVVSIAACQILLGLSLAALLASGRRQWRLPPITLPLVVFFVWTALSLAVSDDPAAGLPQIRKFYVWLLLVVVFSTFRCLGDVRRLLLTIAGAGTLSALWSFVEFYARWERAERLGEPFYQGYVADRITGFMSHWMTFSGHMMICVLLVAALLLFGAPRPRWPWLVALGLLSLALLLALTRSVWPATAAGAVYLLWFWRRWVILLLPVAGVALLLVAPEPVATRIRSIYRPDRVLDSNQHREVLRETGLEMIAANPWFGVGPEQVERNVRRYWPEDAPRPIPRNWWYGHLHNTYIHYAAERGIVAALALLWLMGRALLEFARGARRTQSGEARFVLHAAAAVVIGVLVAGWWEVNLGDSEMLSTTVAVMGAAYAALQEEQTGA